MVLPNNSPFPPELRTMAIVPRWSIVHVTQKDTVANHSYFVAVYAHMVARVIGWEGPRDLLMFSALLHDLDETVTGDLVGPIKDYILDRDRMDDFVDKKIMDRFGSLVNEYSWMESSHRVRQVEEVDLIIKAADRLDAVLFLVMEQRRGNATVIDLVVSATNRLEASWRDLPANRELIDLTWQTVVLPSIASHRDNGGKGI